MPSPRNIANTPVGVKYSIYLKTPKITHFLPKVALALMPSKAQGAPSVKMYCGRDYRQGLDFAQEGISAVRVCTPINAATFSHLT